MKTISFFTLTKEIKNPAYDGRSSGSFKRLKMIPAGTVVIHEIIPASKGDIYDFERKEWATLNGTPLGKAMDAAEKVPHDPTEYQKFKAHNPHDICWTLRALLEQGIVTAAQCQQAQDDSLDD